MPLETLDEKGFMFRDDSNPRRVYWVRMWGENPWLFIWLPNQENFMSLRQLTQGDIFTFPHNMSDREEAAYREMWENSDANRAANALVPPDRSD